MRRPEAEQQVMTRILEAVADRNLEEIVIHAVSINSLGTMQLGFVQEFADLTGGLVVEIDLCRLCPE